MECLLSTAFDNIAARDTARIRKGLRQIDGLLAQIVLIPASASAPSSAPASPEKKAKGQQASPVRFASPNPARMSSSPARRPDPLSFDSPNSRALSRSPSRIPRKKAGDVKPREELGRDAAYREFWSLQSNFEWNVATRVLECLERVLGLGCGTTIDALLTSTLSLLLGTLLLHNESRALFARVANMTLLLDLLQPSSPTPITAGALDVLTLAILQRPANLRAFEDAEGVLTLVSLYQAASDESVRHAIEAFWGVYLLPEDTVRSVASSSSSHSSGGVSIRSSAEKEATLERCFGGHGVLV